MSISRLPTHTATILHSSQILPSFECAVAAVVQNSLQQAANNIRVTVSPEALRFSVLDDGPGFSPRDWGLALQSGCTSMPCGRGQSLASLAAVASIELYTKHAATGFAAKKLVRGGKVLEDESSTKGHTAVHPNLGRAGVFADVWELFHNIPVRRRAEAARNPVLAIEVTREIVIALSLANPRVHLTLQGGNGLVMYQGGGRKKVAEEMIEAAFGLEGDLEWRRLEGKDTAWFNGCIAKRGHTSSEICLVSMGGVPVRGRCWIHRLIHRIWKAHIALNRTGDAPASHRCAAYVVNCNSLTNTSDRTAAREIVSCNASPTPQAENEMALAVKVALQTIDLPQLVQPRFNVGVDQLSRLASARKRRSSSIEGRFADALVCKRPRKRPSSAWASRETLMALRRPLSEPSSTAARRRFVKQDRERSTKLCIDRPLSAQGVELVCQKLVCGWSNPVYRGKGLVTRTASNTVFEHENSAHYMFLKRAVSIQRNKISKLRIVGQVDRKFIVVVDDNSVMYAVDQHAASERYMYEVLLKQVTPRKVRSVPLRPPKRVLLSHKQRATCLRHSAALTSWGWQVRLSSCGPAEIMSAPVIEKLNAVLDNEDQLLSYVDSLVIGAAKNHIPRPLLNAVASAACHTAVRFGDALTNEQCKSLVWSLSECDSPFLCAHGRPSIVPLAVFDIF